MALELLRRRAGAGYVSGAGAADALRACRLLGGRGYASSVGFWNAEGDPPGSVATANRRAIELLSGSGLDWQLSVKAATLAYDGALLGELADELERRGARLHLDALAPETAERTLALARELGAQRLDVGVTLPSRWARSAADAGAAAEAGLRVRVVKGQWPDPAAGAGDMAASFLSLIDVVAGRAPHIAVATHDAALAREALARVRASSSSCELELLFGLPAERPARVARELSVPVRVYVPFGTAYLPYRLGDAVRDPRLLARLALDALRPARTGWRRLPR